MRTNVHLVEQAAVTSRRRQRFSVNEHSGNDRNQVLTGFQLFQFGVVLNAGQIHAINFVILQQQGFARRTKNWIPAEATKVSATDSMRATRRNVAVQSKGRRTDGSQQEQKCRTMNLTVHEVASNFSVAPSQGA